MKKRKLPQGILLIFIMISVLFTGCASENDGEKAEAPSVTDTGFFLDTTVTITLYNWSDQGTIQRAFDEIRRLESILSVEKAGSEAAQITEQAGKQPVEVGEETREVVEASLRYAEKTGGKFDVTIHPLVKLWNIKDGSGYVPAAEEREEACSRIDYRKLKIDDKSAFLEESGMGVNFGAIAKGYISDRIGDFLRQEGVTSALINMGGNVIAIGEKPEGKPFCVGVQDPFGETGSVVGVIMLEDGALISSGNYERYFIQDGVRYHHILDPDLGAPAEAGLSAVTILTEKGIDGDALSTSVFLLGEEKGRELLEAVGGAEGLFIDMDGNITMTDGMKEKWTAYE